MQISQNAFQASFTCNCQSLYSGRYCEVPPQNLQPSIAPAQYYPQSPYQQAQQSVYGNNAGGYYGMPPQYSTQATNSYGIPQYSPGMFSGPTGPGLLNNQLIVHQTFNPYDRQLQTLANMQALQNLLQQQQQIYQIQQLQYVNSMPFNPIYPNYLNPPVNPLYPNPNYNQSPNFGQNQFNPTQNQFNTALQQHNTGYMPNGQQVPLSTQPSCQTCSSIHSSNNRKRRSLLPELRADPDDTSILIADSENPEKPEMIVIVLHGVGDTPHYLARVFTETDHFGISLRDKRVKYIFPTAPVQPVDMLMGAPVNAWFNIKSMEKSAEEDIQSIILGGILIEEFINLELEKYPLISKRDVVLVGFGQGAAIALFSALLQSPVLKAVVSLSGWLPYKSAFEGEKNKAIVENQSSLLKVFLSHGREDEMISESWAMEAENTLKTGLFDVDLKQYDKKHVISKEEVVDLKEFMESLWPGYVATAGGQHSGQSPADQNSNDQNLNDQNTQNQSSNISMTPSSTSTVNSGLPCCATGQRPSDSTQVLTFDTSNPNFKGCQSTPCQNSGHCQDSNTKDYICDCQPGFQGTYCEVDLSNVSFDSTENGTQITANGHNNENLAQNYQNNDDGNQNDNQNQNENPDSPNSSFDGTNLEIQHDSGGENLLTPNLPIMTCNPNPCKNQGTCKPYFTKAGEEIAYCECVPPFKGEKCEIEPVDGFTCANGGTLTDPSTKSCDCPFGFAGKSCEAKLDSSNLSSCLQNPCKNSGSCSAISENEFECTCAQGFNGNTCEDSANNACETTNICNGGVCKDLPGEDYRCDNCPEGFAGKNCETGIATCDNLSCSNGGVCSEIIGSTEFFCQCMGTGFRGRTCETDIDECSQLANCFNGGTCSNDVGSYTCECTIGYSGDFCEVRDSICNSDPCENGGICVDEMDSFSCYCAVNSSF